MPHVIKGYPVLILVTAGIGLFYFYFAYKSVDKTEGLNILLPFYSLLEGIKKIFTERRTFFLMVLVYVLFLISLIYTDNYKVAGTKLVLHSSMLYLPILFSLTKWHQNKVKRIMNFFTIGILLQLLISFIVACIDTGMTWEQSRFSYVELSYNGIHPTYASVMLNIAFVFNCAFLLFKQYASSKEFYLRIIILPLFIIGVILFASRAGQIGLLFSIIFILGYFIRKISKKQVALILVTFSIVSAVGVFAVRRVVADNITEAVNGIEKFNKRDKSESLRSTAIRLVLWQNSLNILKDNFFGTGIGDSNDELQIELKRNEEQFVHSLGYNSHNQFLTIGLAVGWIGIVLWGLILIFSSLNWGMFKFFQLSIVLIIFSGLMFESMIEKQVGSILIIWVLCFMESAKPTIKSIFK